LQFRTMDETELEDHATCAAEYCWLTVRKDVSSDKMTKKDLAMLFPSDEKADLAYGLLDVDGDGFVIEPEVHAVFQVMYRYVADLHPRSFIALHIMVGDGCFP
jgi:hypothetical protein